MDLRHGKYEISKEQLTLRGDYTEWLYHVKNSETGNTFDYRVSISGSALASRGMPVDTQFAVDTKGDNLLKGWLDKGLERRIQAKVTTAGIVKRELSEKQDWLDWQDFFQLASEKDIKEYFKTYKEIFKKVLKPNLGIKAKAYTSSKHGSLLYLEIQPGRDSFSYQLIKDKGIGSVLMNLPQKGFGGNLENVRFGGVNLVIEDNKIIYIKGENTREVWSKEVAEKEAREQVELIHSSQNK